MSSLTESLGHPQPSYMTVPFYGVNLFITDCNQEPYVPMKPVIEGIGLSWATQFRKLSSNARWGVVKMKIPSLDLHNEAICIPLRKS